MSKIPCSLFLAAALLAPAPLLEAESAPAATPAPFTRAAVHNETDAHDLSPEREAHYTRAVRRWLATLPPVQREQAHKILREAHPDVHVLRVRIREKKAELEGLRFDSATPPDTLPRIGLEIQTLRHRLRQRLLEISEQLRTEVGVPMGPVGEEGFWLNPQSLERPSGALTAPGLGTPVSAPGRP